MSEVAQETIAADGEILAPLVRADNVGAELLQAMVAARAAMKPVGKSGHNDFDNYDYSTMGDYVDASQAALGGAGLAMVITETEPKWFTSISQKMPNGVKVKIYGRLWHAATGQYMGFVGLGEAWDKGDKALFKAITGARKYALQQLFNLYSEDDPERDSVPEDDRRGGKQQSRGNQRQQNGRQQSPPKQQPAPPAPPADAPPAEPPKGHLERARDKIDACTNADEVWAFLKKALASSVVKNDRQLTIGILRHAMDVSEGKRQAQTWADDSVDSLQVLVKQSLPAETTIEEQAFFGF